MEVLVMAGASITVGLVVGILSGMLGVGGGTVLVPVFKLGYHMSAIACTATSLFTIIPTSISGAISHVRNKTCLVRLGVVMGLAGAVTSPLGVWLASVSPDWAIMAAAAVAIGYSSATMLRKAIAMKPKKKGAGCASAAGFASAASAGGSAASDAAAAPSATEGWGAAEPAAAGAVDSEPAAASAAFAAPAFAPADELPKPSRKQMALGAAIGLVAGVASGYVGLGGGFLMVPLMVQFLRMSMKVTSGTSLVAIMILAVPGVAMQGMLGNVNWVVGIAVACGSIPGAVIGARLASRVPERALRFIFGGFLLVAAIVLVVDELGLL